MARIPASPICVRSGRHVQEHSIVPGMVKVIWEASPYRYTTSLAGDNQNDDMQPLLNEPQKIHALSCPQSPAHNRNN